MRWARRTAVLACLLTAGDLREGGNASATPLTSIGAIRASLEEPARYTSVDVRATAMFFDTKQGVLYLQDSTGAVALRVAHPGAEVAPGTRLRVVGEMWTGKRPPVVDGAQLTALELGGPLPDPRPVSVATLFEQRALAEWVEVRGTIRAVSRREGSLALELEDEGRRVHVAAPLAMDDSCLLGSRVRVRGVSTADGPDGAGLLIPDRLQLRMEETPPLDLKNTEAARLPLVTRVRELRRLTDVEARRGYPVRLTAVVTCCGPGRALFVHDGSAEVYVESRRHRHNTRPGDRVELTGVSAAGGFVPMVTHPRIRALGHGPLPPAEPFGPEQLVNAEGDGQWVSVVGIVRSVTTRRLVTEIDISAGGFVRFRFEVPLTEAAEALKLIDARVRVRGVRTAQFNASRQQVGGVSITSSGLEMLTVLDPPPAASEARLLPVKALLQYVPGQRWERQVRVKGVVTYATDDQFYIRDDTGGLLVRGAAKPAAVGDSVEVVGFAGPGLFTPVLEDGRLISRAAGAPLSPKSVNAHDTLNGRFDGDLVRLDGRLLGSSAGNEETRLSLQSGPYLFAAVLGGVEPSLLGLRPGSELRLTGIGAVNGGRPGVPQGFQILLRSREDVLVLRAGPWWTSRRATSVLAALTGVAVLTLAWVLALRRRVQAQSAIIWSRVKRETELQERQRMARELHDTLEQTLTGVSLSLEAASLKLATAPAAAAPLVERAIERVGQSLDEVRRVVWALRDESLDMRGLAASLRETGRQLASCHSDSIAVEIAVEGSPHPFVVPVENNLLRIGQEALTNAVKHGKPSRIDVRLQYADASFRMLVSDDGIGFDPACPPPAGHFGLSGMRERAAEIGARLELASRVNGGTEVQVTLDIGGQV